MDDLTFSFNGRDIPFSDGMTVATALLQANIKTFRETQVLEKPRGAFCMMGACFDCLVIIDSKPNQQACQVIAALGMEVKSQTSRTEILENLK